MAVGSFKDFFIEKKNYISIYLQFFRHLVTGVKTKNLSSPESSNGCLSSNEKWDLVNYFPPYFDFKNSTLAATFSIA